MLFLLLTQLLAASGWAQESDGSAAGEAASGAAIPDFGAQLDELRKALDAQNALIQQQKSLIDSQQKRIEQQQTQLNTQQDPELVYVQQVITQTLKQWFFAVLLMALFVIWAYGAFFVGLLTGRYPVRPRDLDEHDRGMPSEQ